MYLLIISHLSIGNGIIPFFVWMIKCRTILLCKCAIGILYTSLQKFFRWHQIWVFRIIINNYKLYRIINFNVYHSSVQCPSHQLMVYRNQNENQVNFHLSQGLVQKPNTEKHNILGTYMLALLLLATACLNFSGNLGKLIIWDMLRT